ncbi:MAG: M15 family metallopeptidase [Flavobacteriales bacterium]|nr:M15 family metallopeptidase [Flavobacteriales bacterium]
MSKLIVCCLSVFLLSCNSEYESVSLAKVVQSSELKTPENKDILLQTASFGNSSTKKTVKLNNFKKIEKNILLGKFDYKKDSNFSIVSSKYSSKTIYLRNEVLLKFDQMYNAALKDGLKLVIISGTRSFNHQKYIWDRKWAKNILKMDSISAVKEIMKYSSMPSTSRHHWGTDIDLNNLENNYFEIGEGKKIFDWLVENAFKYGFHMTYDNQEETKRTGYKMEKWHWSYMPISEQFLIQFNEYIKCENISSFKGSKFACHQEVDAIKNFVNGINTDFKKIINVTE